MTNEKDLVESTKAHAPAQRAHVLLAIDSIQCSRRFIPESSLVTNALTLPHVVDWTCTSEAAVDHEEVNARPDGICDKPFQTLSGVGEVAVFIEVEIASVG